jgi:hypothetical protein
MKFPSREWCAAAAAALLRDRTVVSAIAEFGPVVVGVVVEKGGRLRSDFCVLLRIEPGRPVRLSYPEDEDELEELEPDYIAWAPYPLCKALLEQALAGGHPDPLRAVLERKVRLQGDLQRLVKHAGRHKGAGLSAIRALPTEFV